MAIDRALFAKALAELERLSPMRAAVVGSDEEAEAAVKKCAEVGLRLAAVSNAGLKPPLRRLTFLPASAFKDTPQGEHRDGMPITSKPSRKIDDILAELDGEQKQ